MSKKTTRQPKVHPIREEINSEQPADSAVAAEEAPNAEEAPPQAETATPRPAFKKRDPPKTQMTFFDRIASIPLADWGTRAKLKLYRLDPIIDRTRGSEYKFVQIYYVPIDEDKLKSDHGSGRYRLYLNLKTAGEKNEREADTIEIDILDPKFPPNIPAGEWVDDPRNKKWAWARPPGAAGGPPLETPATVQAAAATAAASASSQFTEAIKTYSDIRKEVKQEIAPGTAPAAADPLQAGLQIAQMLMTMKADNPMVDIMKEQLRAQNDANEKAREREAALQKELREQMRPHQEQAQPKFGGLKEILAELKDFLPAIKDVLPAVGETARATRSNWLDVARDVAPGVIDWAGKITLALASRAPVTTTNGNGQPQAQIAAPAGQQPQQQQQAAPQEIPKFVRFLSQPFVFDGLQRYFKGFKEDTNTGGDFAQWVFDGGGAEPLKDARSMGSANIMQMFKASAAWMLFKDDEAKLIEFIDQTLAWAPPDADAPEDDEDEQVDLTSSKTSATAKGV